MNFLSIIFIFSSEESENNQNEVIDIIKFIDVSQKNMVVKDLSDLLKCTDDEMKHTFLDKSIRKYFLNVFIYKKYLPYFHYSFDYITDPEVKPIIQNQEFSDCKEDVWLLDTPECYIGDEDLFKCQLKTTRNNLPYKISLMPTRTLPFIIEDNDYLLVFSKDKIERSFDESKNLSEKILFVGISFNKKISQEPVNKQISLEEKEFQEDDEFYSDKKTLDERNATISYFEFFPRVGGIFGTTNIDLSKLTSISESKPTLQIKQDVNNDKGESARNFKTKTLKKVNNDREEGANNLKPKPVKKVETKTYICVGIIFGIFLILAICLIIRYYFFKSKREQNFEMEHP